VQTLQNYGLDLVILFDSTGSMGGEIHEVKTKIAEIGTTLLKLIPQTMVGVCTYRDHGDVYVVKGIPLTKNIIQVQQFLNGISAAGGGDDPEAVLDGLQWVTRNSIFRASTWKIILIFGDAPPHAKDMKACVALVGDFRRTWKRAMVNTVSCGGYDGEEFRQIAEAGGGQAFRISDHRKIMEELLVLVLGDRDRVRAIFRLPEHGSDSPISRSRPGRATIPALPPGAPEPLWKRLQPSP